MSLLKYFMLLLLMYSCNQTESEQEQKENGIHLVLNRSASEVIYDTVITYDRKEDLQIYIRELKDSLKMNKLPNFIYDECLDVSEMGYCYISSHETISLRTDIISNLKKEEIHKILEIGNKQKLKRKCKNDLTAELFNSNKSTFEILKEVLSNRLAK